MEELEQKQSNDEQQPSHGADESTEQLVKPSQITVSELRRRFSALLTEFLEDLEREGATLVLDVRKPNDQGASLVAPSKEKKPKALSEPEAVEVSQEDVREFRTQFEERAAFVTAAPITVTRLRGSVGRTLDEIHFDGVKYLVRAKGTALALMGPYSSRLHANALTITRGVFARNPSKYLRLARAGRLIAITKASAATPTVVLKRPPENADLDVARSRRERDKRRKRARRAEERGGAVPQEARRLAKHDLDDDYEVLRAATNYTAEEVRNALKLLEESNEREQ